MARPPYPNLPARTRILDFIIQFKMENDGLGPSIREIVEATGIASTSSVAYHLDVLEAMGRIERKFHQSRCIAVVGGKWTLKGASS